MLLDMRHNCPGCDVPDPDYTRVRAGSDELLILSEAHTPNWCLVRIGNLPPALCSSISKCAYSAVFPRRDDKIVRNADASSAYTWDSVGCNNLIRRSVPHYSP